MAEEMNGISEQTSVKKREEKPNSAVNHEPIVSSDLWPKVRNCITCLKLFSLVANLHSTSY